MCLRMAEKGSNERMTDERKKMVQSECEERVVV